MDAVLAAAFEEAKERGPRFFTNCEGIRFRDIRTPLLVDRIANDVGKIVVCDDRIMREMSHD